MRVPFIARLIFGTAGILICAWGFFSMETESPFKFILPVFAFVLLLWICGDFGLGKTDGEKDSDIKS
jgi:hypothetical protein